MNRDELRTILSQRLRSVEERLVAACARSGRQRGTVTLIAVTKRVSAEVAGLLHELGVADLGENRPQELWSKAAVLPSSVRWHLIGHLQRNKVERTLPLVQVIHSVDSQRLLTEIDKEAGRLGRMTKVLLEVNASHETSKQGFAPDEVLGLTHGINELEHIRVEGLMTMAALEDDPERCRPAFATLRDLRDRLRTEVAERHSLDHLSMGMTNDFEVAIEEGATMLRLGTVLFEGL